MSAEKELHQIVIDRFGHLRAVLNQLRYDMTITDQDLPAWFQAPAELAFLKDASLRTQAFALIAQLEYLDEQNPREILVGAGLIAASNATLETVAALNQAKDDFKAAMLALKAQKKAAQDEAFNEKLDKLLSANGDFRQTLKKHGLARLHLKQCYRRLPYFDRRPLKVSWTWANTRAITRISQDEASALLMKQGRDLGIQQQLKLLSELSPQEPLAIVQELAPHLRANVILPDYEKKAVQRLMVKGPIPLFYPNHEHLELPPFKAPGQKKSRDLTRPVRKDVKLDPDVFLPAIRVHRYKVWES